MSRPIGCRPGDRFMKVVSTEKLSSSDSFLSNSQRPVLLSQSKPRISKQTIAKLVYNVDLTITEMLLLKAHKEAELD